MTEKYPFFRDEDERTLAVIGEEAIVSDLGGVYQKPYAVLTQQRIYCKGERLSGGRVERGNFINDSSEILSASFQSSGQAFRSLFWTIFVLSLVSLVSLILLVLPILFTVYFLVGFFIPCLIGLGGLVMAVIFIRNKRKAVIFLLIPPVVSTVVSIAASVWGWLS